MESGAAPANQSISFTTAAVVIALQRADEAGFSVPRRLTRRGLECLQRMANDNGTFECMLHHDSESTRSQLGAPGAAGRGPVCALALYRSKKAKLDDLRRALDLFVEHRAGLVSELGKSLMHTGPDAQGCHYLMFDYAFAAATLRELPEEERGPYRQAVLEEVMRARTGAGTFVGTPRRGPACGTGLALLAFESLHPGP